MFAALQGQSAMSTLEMTSSYLAINLPVFPCQAGRKKPATERGFHDASLDPALVARWFADGSKYNVAIPTGAVSGGWVLDIDPGKGGNESLAKLIEGIAMPPTPIARTGRGGLHYWWAMPEGRKVKSTTNLMPGVDIRGDGGYVVVPPSTLPEGAYEWVVAPWEVPFAECPTDLLKRLDKGYQMGKDPDYGDSKSGAGFDIEGALRGVPEGQRDETLFKLASRLRADNVGKDSAITMLEMAAGNCTPPMDPATARKKVEWVYEKYEAGWSNEAQKGVASSSSFLSSATSPSAPTLTVTEPDQVSEWLGQLATRRTDLGNAIRLAGRLRGEVLWCHPWKCWLVWDGNRWHRDESGGKPVLQSAFLMLRDSDSKASDSDSIKWALKSQDRKQINNMIELAKFVEGMSALPDDFDRDDWLLNVANGTLDLRTGELRAHRREDLITRITDVPYDPDAQLDRWAAFLDRVTDGSRDLQMFLYRAAGYSLTGSTREQCLMFLYGSGCNGKSTFMDLLMHVMGEYAMHTPTETLMVKGNNSSVPNDLARLKGARLVAATETEAGKRLAESLVKQLTGGDPITARFLHAEYFTFLPTFKLWLSGNHKPAIRGVDEGMWRRIQMVPFEVRIPEGEVDPDLKDKLRQEAPGILAWCVAGCLDWQQNRLEPPAAVQEATGGYRREMDTIGDFIEECIESASGEFLSSGDLYKAYRAWCEEHGEHVRSQKALSQEMVARGYFLTQQKNHSAKRGFEGITFSRDSGVHHRMPYND